MVRGYRTLMFKPDRSPCKTKGLSFTLLWQNVSKSRRTYTKVLKTTKTHTYAHTQAHRTAKLSFIPVILLLPKGSHTFQVQLQVFTYHIYIHTGCGVCGMGVLWALTTTTLPQRPNDKQISFLFIWFKHPDVTDKTNSKKGRRVCNTL